MINADNQEKKEFKRLAISKDCREGPLEKR